MSSLGPVESSRWDMLRLALQQRGEHDDNLYRGFYLPEWAMPIVRREIVFERLWVGLMLVKLVVAIALNRVGFSYLDHERWEVAIWDCDTFQSQEGTFYSWAVLATPEGFRPSRWRFDFCREST